MKGIKPIVTSLFQAIHVFLYSQNVLFAIIFSRGLEEDKMIIVDSKPRVDAHVDVAVGRGLRSVKSDDKGAKFFI